MSRMGYPVHAAPRVSHLRAGAPRQALAGLVDRCRRRGTSGPLFSWGRAEDGQAEDDRRRGTRSVRRDSMGTHAGARSPRRSDQRIRHRGVRRVPHDPNPHVLIEPADARHAHQAMRGSPHRVRAWTRGARGRSGRRRRARNGGDRRSAQGTREALERRERTRSGARARGTPQRARGRRQRLAREGVPPERRPRRKPLCDHWICELLDVSAARRSARSPDSIHRPTRLGTLRTPVPAGPGPQHRRGADRGAVREDARPTAWTRPGSGTGARPRTQRRHHPARASGRDQGRRRACTQGARDLRSGAPRTSQGAEIRRRRHDQGGPRDARTILRTHPTRNTPAQGETPDVLARPRADRGNARWRAMAAQERRGAR